MLGVISDRASVQDVEQIEDAVVEQFAPVGYRSLVDYAEQNGLSAVQLQELFFTLSATLDKIYNDYFAYTENLELFSPSMTNMRYLLIPKSVDTITAEDYEQKASTNIKGFGNSEIQNQSELLEYMRTAYKDYLIFDSSDMSFEINNMPLSVSNVSSYLKEYPPSIQGDYIVAIAVDPRYLASDNLQEYKQQYDAIRPISHMAAYGAALGSLLYLITLVYLTIAAGRRTDGGDTTIYLNGFDRVKTEIAVLLAGIPFVIILLISHDMFRSFDNLLQMGFFGGTLTFVLNLMFLALFLSMVRRLRSHTLWSNSLCCVLLETLRAVLRHRKTTTRVIVLYLLFLAANLGLLLCGIIGFLLALALDFIVGIWLLQNALQRQRIVDGTEKIAQGDLAYQIPTENLKGDIRAMAEAVNRIGEGLSMAVEQRVKDERLKTDLITNVSHDIKTPLTSIINYVDLLKREDVQNERAVSYIAILEDKAQRLKHLTDDLVEASKISSGNIKLEFVRINFQELINQTNGEFCEKFEAKELQLVVSMPREPVIIEADGRRLWRVIENLYNNVAKYAMPRTRVYVELVVVGHMVRFSVKNISEQPLNIDAGELTERFIRGDVARSTEGSGLGLSIAKNLTELQRGSFDIYLDGDLFRATVIFPEAPQEKACNPPERSL
jgi:signal transduction histidine kinase